jgi:hypothetical protein
MAERDDRYEKALSRTDLTQWLVHFTKPGLSGPAFDVLKEILKSGRVLPSKAEHITRNDPAGAACFYEVPPQNWKELIATNPNLRQPYGMIVGKKSFWWLGGRPAIYTEDSGSQDWPKQHRYRLITTNLSSQPQPIDWMHEREWRIRGELVLGAPWGDPPRNWWWPCVKTVRDCQLLYREFDHLHQIYVMDLRRVLGRNEILI